MSNKNILNYDTQDYDMNALFMFNFDQLKFLITSIAKNQKNSEQRIGDIEDKILIKDKKLDDLEKLLKKQENFITTKLRTLTNIASNNTTSHNREPSYDKIPNIDNSHNNSDIIKKESTTEVKIINLFI